MLFPFMKVSSRCESHTLSSSVRLLVEKREESGSVIEKSSILVPSASIVEVGVERRIKNSELGVHDAKVLQNRVFSIYTCKR